MKKFRLPNIAFLGLILTLVFQSLTAQNYPNALSNGELVYNQSEKIPVKIFSSPDYFALKNASTLKTKEPLLVILTNNNTVARNQDEFNFLQEFYTKEIQSGKILLDKDFEIISEITSEKDLSASKYLLNTQGNSLLNNKQNYPVQLNTDFTIWDPSDGINIFGFKLRFYGLMFVIAFGLGFMLMKKMFKIDGADEKFLDPLFTWTLFGTIFGARIGHVLFYDRQLITEDFWSVFLPIRTKPHLELTGFSGLASHGAAFMLIATTLYYSYKIIKKNPFWVYDRLGITVALAGFFIRMGNFFNSEIIGKPVAENSPFAFFFTQQGSDYGVTVPRYPTQLIEAVGYLALFFVLWFIYLKTDKKHQQGWLFGFFFAVLWSIRFVVEFLKEPQGEEYITFAGLNTGQILSIPFILLGLGCMWYSKTNVAEKV